MNSIDIILYFLVAALGGALNAVAGGGTFLTFPLMILNGISPLTANVMSTIALWPGSVASAAAYRKILPTVRIKEFLVISIVGSSIGTALLLLLPEKLFEHMVPWLLLTATLIFTFGSRFSPHAEQRKERNRTYAIMLQLVIAIYGGYFGAGIGILMLAMLQLLGFSHIHQMNALKTVLGSTINAVAVAVFIVAGKVIWPLAAVMIAGGVLGGYGGAKIAMRVNPLHVRRMVSITGALMTVYFFCRG